LAIVLTSGMTAFSGAAEDAMHDLPILRKPYRCGDLSQAIKAALDAAAPERIQDPPGSLRDTTVRRDPL
jgi:hypothetical protein